MQVREADVRRVCGPRYRTPRWVAPLWMVLLALQVERRLRRFQVCGGGGGEGDARRGQPLFERRPYRRLLSGERAASFVHRAEAARQEPVAVDDHLSVATSVPVTTGITEPPTSILVGMSLSAPYSSRIRMVLWRRILVPFSLMIETLLERGTSPYLTAKPPSGPLADPVAGSSSLALPWGANIRLYNRFAPAGANKNTGSGARPANASRRRVCPHTAASTSRASLTAT